jgi:2-polyprenyl-3-methyl-5-hydroxy-6-metoxy-1,4-benzoquinol methylase
MSSGNYLPEVRRQYEALPYPARDPQSEQTRLIEPWHDQFALINHYCFAGRGRFDRDFRVLVAGGGTGDSAIFLAEQLAASGADVVYLDISASSMKIAQARADIRRLQNIRWVHGSLLDLTKLGLGSFDYISCTGVLHHLADPGAGLDALTGALKPEGMMVLMVYARIGRTAIYQMQELLRLVCGDDDDIATRIERARQLLHALPKGNWYRRGEDKFDNETAQDSGIYDLLLHSQDRAYSVPELYDWVESSGLHVASLMSPCRGIFNPSHWIVEPGLLASLQALDLRSQQAACELLIGNIIQHTVYCCPGPVRIASVDDLDNIPFHFPADSDVVFDTLCENPGQALRVDSLFPGLHVDLQPRQYALGIFQYLDGLHTIGEIFELVREDEAAAGRALDEGALRAEFGAIFERFNELDMMLLRHRSLPAFATTADLHQQQYQRPAAAA